MTACKADLTGLLTLCEFTVLRKRLTRVGLHDAAVSIHMSPGGRDCRNECYAPQLWGVPAGDWSHEQLGWIGESLCGRVPYDDQGHPFR
jgi:hypothetical protein